uniref:Uncharacterized protein n=1 Tax=Glossina palpalis gambiensis TaxID=67801 RepID=A0A1B0APZ7_9MUSC
MSANFEIRLENSITQIKISCYFGFELLLMIAISRAVPPLVHTFLLTSYRVCVKSDHTFANLNSFWDTANYGAISLATFVILNFTFASFRVLHFCLYLVCAFVSAMDTTWPCKEMDECITSSRQW